MDSKKRLLLYPFGVQACPLVRHKDLIEGYYIQELVSPPGWSFTDEDASMADGGTPMGYIVKEDFQASLASCESVLFMESDLPLDFDRSIYPKIEKAVEMNKEILCTIELTNEQEEKIEDICKRRGVDFKYYKQKSNDQLRFGIRDEELFRINTPVVFVLGGTERSSKFEIQLALREKFIKEGYKVSQVGTRSYCELLGFHSFPSFMYGLSLHEHQKVFAFNHFIKRIEMNEQPDVIIIGIPGAMMLFNETVTNRFGILAYQVAHAIKPDAVVVSTIYGEFVKEFFEKLKIMMNYRLGFEIDVYNLSNVRLDINKTEIEKSAHYYTLDWKAVDDKINKIKDMETPVFNVLNAEDGERMAQAVIDRLVGYSRISAV